MPIPTSLFKKDIPFTVLSSRRDKVEAFEKRLKNMLSTYLYQRLKIRD